MSHRLRLLFTAGWGPFIAQSRELPAQPSRWTLQGRVEALVRRGGVGWERLSLLPYLFWP